MQCNSGRLITGTLLSLFQQTELSIQVIQQILVLTCSKVSCSRTEIRETTFVVFVILTKETEKSKDDV